MGDEPRIEEVIKRFDALLLKHYMPRQARTRERQEFIEREQSDLRALWWDFDPLDLIVFRENIEDEYDGYVIATFAALRDGGDLVQVVLDALTMMAMTKRVSLERVVRFCCQLHEWWLTKL